MPDVPGRPLFVPAKVFVVPGTRLVKEGVYLYQCPLCGNRFRYDDPYEPICTGPGSEDTHAPEVMVSMGKDKRLVQV